MHLELIRTPAALRRDLVVALAVGAVGAVGSAQFDDEWVGFTAANSRLVVAHDLGIGDIEEKDYFAGDLDNDGWDDLVVVRKQPFATTGRRPNVLLMNENGTLVDRTAQYASASTVPGDLGFLTPTNDRDVVFADVDGDGWLDVITSVVQSSGQPKHISHPRIYMNLGNDLQGSWRGLEYQEHRFPQIYSFGQTCDPSFSAVAAGDLTGNGLPDLYFGHYDSPTCDAFDRILINDGTGVFVDETDARIDPFWLDSGIVTSVAIADMTGNGVNDLVRMSGEFSPAEIFHNDANNPGFFPSKQAFAHGAGYHINVGDLNADGRFDAVVGHDGADRYFLNDGTSLQGQVLWALPTGFEFVTGGDDGIGGNVIIADLDADGWNDVIIADVDTFVPGCSRRMHVYHNRGGVVGGAVTLREEAGTSGWRGAVGLLPPDLQGTFDIAVIDIDRNGYPDLVIGRCTGTSVWLNTLGGDVGFAYCSCDGSGTAAPCGNPGSSGAGCRNSSGRGAVLTVSGSASVSAHALAASTSELPANQPALLFAGENAVNGGNGAPFGDGLRCAGGTLVRLGVRFADASGVADWGNDVAPQSGWTAGTTRRLQSWYRDPGGSPCGSSFNLTNGWEVTFLP